MSPDIHDLQEYAASGSEPAFRRIVERHSAMVRGAARRLIRDEALAEEITQSVFILLARKARSVAGDRLTGWLHLATRGEARNAIRKEMRRARLHLNYIETMKEKPSVEASWEEIVPYLDHAVSRLSPEDRELVLLRYFEERSFQEISVATGRSVEACKKRAQRALDRLALLLKKRGAVIGGPSLASLLAVSVLQPAPAAAAAISVLSVNSASSLPTLVQGISLFLPTMTAKQITGIAAAIIALATLSLVSKRNRSDSGQVRDSPDQDRVSLSGAETSGLPSRERARKGNAEDRSINWAELARTKFSSRNHTIRSQEAKLLEERLRGLSDDELADGLAKVATLDANRFTRIELYWMLATELSKRDPMRVLDRLPMDKEEYDVWISGSAFKALVEKDPAVAEAWLERQIDGKMLEGETAAAFQREAVKGQLKSDPEQAVRRIMELPEEHQADVLAGAAEYQYPKAFEIAVDHFRRTGDDTLIHRMVASRNLEQAVIASSDDNVEWIHRMIDQLSDESTRAAAHERVDEMANRKGQLEGVPVELLMEGKE